MSADAFGIFRLSHDFEPCAACPEPLDLPGINSVEGPVLSHALSVAEGSQVEGIAWKGFPRGWRGHSSSVPILQLHELCDTNANLPTGQSDGERSPACWRSQPLYFLIRNLQIQPLHAQDGKRLNAHQNILPVTDQSRFTRQQAATSLRITLDQSRCLVPAIDRAPLSSWGFVFLAWRLAIGRKGHHKGLLIETDLEITQDARSPQQIETNPQFIREAQRGS